MQLPWPKVYQLRLNLTCLSDMIELSLKLLLSVKSGSATARYEGRAAGLLPPVG